nr:beta-ketoacyl reductase [Actinomadura graeca]
MLTLPVPLDPGGTVLITGGTGALGAETARHLAARHGVRRLLLLNRTGHAAPGADALVEELSGLGAHVTLAACDIGDRAALAAALAAVPAEHPLTAVVHAAGIVGDGTVPSLEPAQIEAVLRVKADSAWHLHELTRDADLSAFVLYSSVAGLIGGAGQGGYAAANNFLDALAQYRQALGLPGTSLAWGHWDMETGMAGRLTDADRARNARTGVVGLSVEQGLALFDAALAGGGSVLAPVRLDLARMRRQAQGYYTPAVLRRLVGGTASQAGGAPAPDLARSLSGLAQEDRERAVLDLVGSHAMAVLGHGTAKGLDPALKFRELGFDSLTAVELRNRLSAATGLRLPATLVFDHPGPAELARYLLAELDPPEADPLASALTEIDRLEQALRLASADEAARETLARRLRGTLQRLGGTDGRNGQDGAAPTGVADRIGASSAEEIFEFIDRDLGRETGLGEPAHDETDQRAQP